MVGSLFFRETLRCLAGSTGHIKTKTNVLHCPGTGWVVIFLVFGLLLFGEKKHKIPPKILEQSHEMFVEVFFLYVSFRSQISKGGPRRTDPKGRTPICKDLCFLPQHCVWGTVCRLRSTLVCEHISVQHVVVWPTLRKAPDMFKFLRHILFVRPNCSHRCVSLRESPLKPVIILKHATRISTEQTSKRTKWFKHIAFQIVLEHLLNPSACMQKKDAPEW